MNRAYSLLNVKAISDDGGDMVIEGIASTPTTDRMGDVVESKGARFKLPMPLLWQHQSDKPVGRVEFAKPTDAGIPFRAILPTIAEAGLLKDRIDEAKQSVKAGLVAAVSIGFRAIDGAVEQMKNGGLRFKEWEWLELSLVTIPANSEALIHTVKAIDSTMLAASGHVNREPAPRAAPGVSGSTQTAKRGAIKLIRRYK